MINMYGKGGVIFVFTDVRGVAVKVSRVVATWV